MTSIIRAACLCCCLCFIGLISNAQSNDLIDLEFGTLDNFDVATWNIRFFPTNGQTTIDYVAEIIEELELDVIAIQEIDDSDEFDQLLSQLQGYDGFYDDNEFLKLGYIYNIQSVTVNDQYQLYEGSSFGNPFPRRPLVVELTFMEEHDFVLINNHFKCCGNSILDENNFWDEETRRAYASSLLKDYIDFYLSDENVIMLGDLNDLLTDPPQNNVFQVYLDDPANYRFADMDIATGNASQWSYPSWPSHLDHILVSNELFGALEDPESQIATIQIDDFFPGGFNGYDSNVSDHLPVGFGFDPAATTLSADLNKSDARSFDVFPNPSKGAVQVKAKVASPIETIRVFDQMGRLVFVETFTVDTENYFFDLSHLPSGLYSINLNTVKGIGVTKKLVLSH